MRYSSFAGRRRRRQRQLDSQRMQDRQRLSDLAGFLALFEVDDKPQAGSRGQRQIFLRDAEAFPRSPDERPICWGVYFNVSLSPNVTVREYYSVEAHRFKRILPIGNVSLRLG